jgi:hypothetical protein
MDWTRKVNPVTSKKIIRYSSIALGADMPLQVSSDLLGGSARVFGIDQDNNTVRKNDALRGSRLKSTSRVCNGFSAESRKPF